MAGGPNAPKQDNVTVAIGFTAVLGGREITVEPQDLTEIDEGTFTIDLPEDETRTVGSLRQFYDDVDKIIAQDKLPDLPQDQLPASLIEALDAEVTLRKFLLKVEKFEFKAFEIDVRMAAEWTLPNTQLSVRNPRVVLRYTRP